MLHFRRFNTKYVDPEALEDTVLALKKEGKKIVTVNGSFDLLHAGHLKILEEAARQGDILFVALNTDRSIQTYKSPLRPVIALEHRLQMMAALEMVDFVTWFDETSPIALLSKIKPHVHVNGAEYGENCIEAETVREGGGRIHIVNLVPGLSTSLIFEKMKTLCV